MPPSGSTKTLMLLWLISLALCSISAVAQGPPAGLTRVIVKPDTVIFTANASGSLPSRMVRIQRVGPPGAALTYTAAVSTTSGGSWLSATPLNGTIPNSLTLTATPGNLGPGTYNGKVTVTPSGTGATPQTVNVTLRILTGPGGAPAAFVRPASLAFRMVQGGTNPEPRTLTVSSPTGGASFTWASDRKSVV